MTAREIVSALRGTWSGHTGTANCPAHEDSTPSLSVTEREGRVLVRCHAGCPQDAVIAALRSRRLWPAVIGEKNQHASERPNETQDAALRIWKQTKGAAGTPVETYLKSRGIELPAIPDVLRFHGRLLHKPNKQTLPAMVAGVANKRGVVVAIHRTYLRPDGAGKADVEKPKMMLGPAAGGAVRLSDAGDVLVIAEGIETALSVLTATGLPTWAALSTTGLSALDLPPLPLAAEVIIAADADTAGLTAARAAAARWVREGRRVRIAVPPDGTDFNDVLRTDGPGRVRDLVNAADTFDLSGDEAPDADASSDRRRLIRLDPARWNDSVRAAAATVQDILYLRDTVPVILCTAAGAGGREVADADGDAVELGGVRYQRGTPVLVPARPPLVRFHLDERCRIERGRGEKWTPTRCPADIAGQVVEAAPELGFQPVAGISRVPLFLEGEMVTKPGYHAGTGFVINAPALPGVGATPSRQEAERALERLLRPFRGYLDSAEVDRCAVAAAALTAVARPSLPTAPAILLDGNTQGCGKGKLARALTALATGMLPAIITEGHSVEEMEKRISAAILAGAPAVLLDNLQRHLQSSALESGLTEGVATIRVFGTLEVVTVPFRSLVLLTANNATLRRDMLRRALPVRIVAPTEAPERRRFDFDPVAETQRDRIELLTAAFTVLRAWSHVRHLPDSEQYRRPLGSFEGWADLVAGAVAWLTGMNPIELIEARKAADPQVAIERQLIEALAAKFGHREWKAADAVEALDERDLWAAALPRMKGERPTSAEVGNWLRSRRDRVYGSLMLVGSADRNGITLWCLKEASEARGLRGVISPPLMRTAGMRVLLPGVTAL